MKELLQKLIKNNIHISLKAGELSVKVPKTGVDPMIINEIRANKQALISYLSNLTDPGNSEIPVIPTQASYPVSYTQAHLYELSELEQGSIAYNIPGTIEMGIPIDEEKFTEAFYAVVDRHEILRTVFRTDESGELRQYVLDRKGINLELEITDLTAFADKEDRIGNTINNDAYLPFDLNNGPLFRAILFKMASDQYILYYNFHSIIADGESIEIFTREAMGIFELLQQGQSLNVPKLPIQYKDFVVWQQTKLEEGVYEEHKKYWTNYLAGELPPLEMSFQKARPAGKTFRGKLLGTNFSLANTKKIKAFANEKGRNLFSTLIASWKVMLHHYTAEKDLIVGIPALGRDHPNLENQMGPYINNIAIRNSIDPQESFLSFYEKVKDAVLKSSSFQMYPYKRLAEDLAANKDKSRNPLFDMVVVLQREEQILEDFQLSHVEETTILNGGIGKKYVDTIVAKYDLEIDFRELGGCLWFNINYNTDLYDQEPIEEMMMLYKDLLLALIENNKLPLHALLEQQVVASK